MKLARFSKLRGVPSGGFTITETLIAVAILSILLV